MNDYAIQINEAYITENGLSVFQDTIYIIGEDHVHVARARAMAHAWKTMRNIPPDSIEIVSFKEI